MDRPLGWECFFQRHFHDLSLFLYPFIAVEKPYRWFGRVFRLVLWRLANATGLQLPDWSEEK
jgi:hypothetical protein